MTRLQSVQEIMELSGAGTISVLDTGGPSLAADAERILYRCIVEVQTLPWHYNTKINLEITTDANGVATVPTGTTTIDTAGPSASIDATQLGTKLYDRENNTDNLGESTTITVEATLNYEWGCIPLPIRQYMTKCATVKMCMKMNRNDLLRDAYAEREKFYVRAMQYDTTAADHNILGNTESQRLLGRLDQIGRFPTFGGSR